tara:strand:+ start:5311 stop:6546 length:1236 start_codon:yes stop_codon:yes gene_type:complete
MKKHLLILICLSVLFITCKKESIFLSDKGTLPIIKITLEEKYLWSPDSGIYLLDDCFEKWEFPAIIEYSENEKTIFNDSIGLRIKGEASRGKSMKSFGVYWREKYGKKKLEYQVFPNTITSDFKRLFLRNSGNDFGKTHIKDASISMIYKDYANVEFQEYKPCVLYLNNEYWGIYNIREMMTPHHFDYHFNVNNNEVDLLERSELVPEIDNGSNEQWLDIINFIQNNDLSDNDNYNILYDMIDIDSYIDYIIIQTYICNTDWPINNVKWWRERTSVDYTKWRWIVFDTDRAFEKNNIGQVWLGDLYGNYYNENKKEGFYVFNNLINNSEFKIKFLERYLFFINTVFDKKRVENIILNNKERIKIEYSNHQIKWNTLDNNQWSESIDEMIEFNNKRNDIMKEIIKNLQDENN